jgi:hypothetical protein
MDRKASHVIPEGLGRRLFDLEMNRCTKHDQMSDTSTTKVQYMHMRQEPNVAPDKTRHAGSQNGEGKHSSESRK